MVFDNTNFEKMAKNFPRGFRVKSNPVVYASSLGMRGVCLSVLAGIPIYLLWSNWRVNFPYSYLKVQATTIISRKELNTRPYPTISPAALPFINAKLPTE